MDDPVRKAMVHHAGQFGQLYLVTMQMNTSGRAVKCKIKNAVIPFTQQVEIVLKLFACIACQVAELRLHGLRDQLERR